MLAWDIHRVYEQTGQSPRLYEYDAYGEYGATTCIKRFGGWLDALRATGIEPHPSQRVNDKLRTKYGVFRAVRRFYTREGRPPTIGEAADEQRNLDTIRTYGRWDDILRSSGVPGRADVVAETIAKRLTDRNPWQDYVEFRATDLTDATDIGSSEIGNLLRDIFDGTRTPDAADAFELTRLPRSGCTTWQAREPLADTDAAGSVVEGEP